MQAAVCFWVLFSWPSWNATGIKKRWRWSPRRTKGPEVSSYLQAVEDDEEDQHPELPVRHVQPSPQPGDGDQGEEIQDQGDLWKSEAEAFSWCVQCRTLPQHPPGRVKALSANWARAPGKWDWQLGEAWQSTGQTLGMWRRNGFWGIEGKREKSTIVIHTAGCDGSGASWCKTGYSLICCNFYCKQSLSTHLTA